MRSTHNNNSHDCQHANLALSERAKKRDSDLPSDSFNFVRLNGYLPAALRDLIPDFSNQLDQCEAGNCVCDDGKRERAQLSSTRKESEKKQNEANCGLHYPFLRDCDCDRDDEKELSRLENRAARWVLFVCFPPNRSRKRCK